jgi:hypothetical protein
VTQKPRAVHPRLAHETEFVRRISDDGVRARDAGQNVIGIGEVKGAGFYDLFAKVGIHKCPWLAVRKATSAARCGAGGQAARSVGTILLRHLLRVMVIGDAVAFSEVQPVPVRIMPRISKKVRQSGGGVMLVVPLKEYFF